MPRKYVSNRSPLDHPEFSDLSPSRKTYVWNAWNENRMKDGLPRVDPPLSSRINVTFRPKADNQGVRPSSTSISYNQWRDNRSAGPLLDAFNVASERTVEMQDAGLGHRVHNDPELNDLI